MKKFLVLSGFAVSALALAHFSQAVLVQGAGQIVDAQFNKVSVSASLSQTATSCTGTFRVSQVSGTVINDISASYTQVKLGSLIIVGNTGTYTGPATCTRTVRSVTGNVTTSYSGILTFVAVDNKAGWTVSTNYDTANVAFNSIKLNNAGQPIAWFGINGQVKQGDIVVINSTAP